MRLAVGIAVDERQSWPEPAVELRLGKISARLAQDLVGLPKLAVLAFQSLQLCRHIRGNTGAHTTVALGLLHPLMQRLRRAADLGGDRRDRRPARGMLAFVIQNHSHRAGADLGRELIGRLACHGSTFSGVGASDQPGAVHCPTCGHYYDNAIADQFEIVQDKDGLYNALIISQEKLHELDAKAQAERNGISQLEERITRINHVLGVRKADVSFNDVVVAQGRNEAGKIIRGRIDDIDVTISRKRREEDAENETMRAAVSGERTREIKAFFKDRLFEFAEHLSVRLDTGRPPPITSVTFGRGSEGPRAIIAYYYAFLHTARRYSSCAFCPIVIDAPNQQGQDDMQRVMRFIIDKRPPDSQVIVATEDLFGLTESDATIVHVGKRANQLLDEDKYDEVSDIVRPYLEHLI